MESSKKTMSLDEFLNEPSVQLLKATIEPIKDDVNKVKITPFVPGGACSCNASLTLPKSIIESVEPTGETKACCGKMLRVVEIKFHTGKAIDIGELFVQLTSRKTHDHSQHEAQNMPSQPYQFLSPTIPMEYGGQFYHNIQHPKPNSVPAEMHGFRMSCPNGWYSCCCGNNCGCCSHPCTFRPCVNPCD